MTFSSPTEKELLDCIRTEFPQELSQMLDAFCHSYKKATASEKEYHDLLPILYSYVREVKKNLHNPYLFSHFHKQERDPFDFYRMALSLVQPLIDQKTSSIHGKEILVDLEKALQRGENVIFLANHQTEIDPQIISLMVEPYSQAIAEKTVYIAGHRVTTDPMAIPFSRGCNLICIYSKKHIEHTPESRADRLQHNARSLNQIEELLRKGGVAFYVAPSGGRDRWDESGEVQIAPFDPQSIEMFRLFAKRTSVPTHFHLLTLSTIDLLPPPKERRVALGEERIASRGPVHLSFSQELFFDEEEKVVDKKQLRQERADRLTQQVKETFLHFHER